MEQVVDMKERRRREGRKERKLMPFIWGCKQRWGPYKVDFRLGIACLKIQIKRLSPTTLFSF